MFLDKKTLFFTHSPEIPTSKELFVSIHSDDEIVEFNLNKNFHQILGILSEFVFREKTIIAWDFKNFLSYVQKYTLKQFNFEKKIIDLKVIEAYLGIREDRPKSYSEAIERFRRLKGDWKKVYKSIHLPLICNVVPSMENIGVIFNKKILFPYYQIEGQINGRLKCSIESNNNFNPHSIIPEQKDEFKPLGEDKKFVLFDFKFMEVCILQYLSQDKNILKLLSQGDFYSELFKLITGKKCEEAKHRNFCKSLFLPIVFGFSKKGIIEKFNISEKFASHILNTMYKEFPAGMEFCSRFSNQKEVVDCLGRIRKFDLHDATKIRNFVIQSPSATICLEKLIQLNKLHPVAFHIHDAYCLYSDVERIPQLINNATNILESPSELMPGLKLKIACKVGEKLNSLTNYQNEVTYEKSV